MRNVKDDQPATPYTHKHLREDNPKTNGNGKHHGPIDETVSVDGISKCVVTLDELNEEYALLEVPGERATIVYRPDSMPVAFDNFSLRLAGKVVQVITTNKNGQPVEAYSPAGKVWRGSHGKHRYRSIVFTAGDVPDDAMNLFVGYGVKPIAGNCPLILQHIEHVICSGVEATFGHMIDLIAWQIQNIGKASRIIVNLISEDEQTGKGTFMGGVMLKIFGRAGYMTPRIEDITGQFNEILRGKSFLVLDEALFAGNRAGANQIKGYAASDFIPISAKFLPNLMVPNGLNIWTLSNEKVPVHIGQKDARHWTLRVSPEKKGNRKYWDNLYEEISNGGCEAFLHQMLNHDIGTFSPQCDIPRENDVHTDIALRSLAPSDPRNWIMESIECEQLVNVTQTEIVEDEYGKKRPVEVPVPWVAESKVPPKALLAGYKLWVQGLRGRNVKTFRPADVWEVLSELGFTSHHDGTKRTRKVPDPLKCMEKINASVS